MAGLGFAPSTVLQECDTVGEVLLSLTHLHLLFAQLLLLLALKSNHHSFLHTYEFLIWTL